MDATIKRVPTGIKNFDEQISGGFPEGFTVLLAGGPGTGKSIFGLAYLYNGAKNFGENGVYISFEQDAEDIKKQAFMFGWDFEILGEKAQIISLSPSGTVDALLNEINKYIKLSNAKRLVIDSFTTLFSVSAAYEEEIEGSRQIVKKNVLEFFSKIKNLDCTSLVISETPTGTKKLSEDGMSEFACDGIILLKKIMAAGEMMRVISVEKMRATKINPDIYSFDFTNNGIELE